MLDVDDTTLTTWNYELYSNWDFNPATNAIFVGLTSGSWTGNVFPATPGMVALANHAHALGYSNLVEYPGAAVFQHQATVANLQDDSAAGLPPIDQVTLNGNFTRGRRGLRAADASRVTAGSPTACSPSRRSASTRPT